MARGCQGCRALEASAAPGMQRRQLIIRGSSHTGAGASTLCLCEWCGSDEAPAKPLVTCCTGVCSPLLLLLHSPSPSPSATLLTVDLPTPGGPVRNRCMVLWSGTACCCCCCCLGVAEQAAWELLLLVH
jgi:hypothetical protein